MPNGFVFSPDGRYLYGSSYYTGVSNIFRYDLAGEEARCGHQRRDRLLPAACRSRDGSLIVFRYSGEGFVPTRIEARPLEDVSAITFLGERLVAEHPVAQGLDASARRRRSPFDDTQTRGRRYRLAGGLGLESLYPVVQGYKNTGAAGDRFNFSDPLQLNRGDLTATYSPDTGPAGR